MVSKKIIKLTLVLLAIIIMFTGSMHAQGEEKSVFLIPLDATITAGTASFITRQIREAEEMDVEAIIILLNTPGGLLDATLDLNRVFRATSIPIVLFVAPSGSMAASAGAFLVLASDIAAMAPGTTIGAAQPLSISPGGVEPADEKTLSFLAGHIGSLAKERGRPEDIAKKFVTENLTLDAWEALELGVIDLMASTTPELLKMLQGYEVTIDGRKISLQTEGAQVIEREMVLRERFQNWISDPQIAFLILMLGIMGIYFGLSMPGTFVPEILGVIALLMGIYGIGLFDTNTAGIVFLILGIVLIAAEAFTSSFGILGVGGAIGLLIGAILLPHEPLMAPDWYHTFRVTVFGVVLGVSILLLIVIQRLITSRHYWRKSGSFFKPPETARTIQELTPSGLVKTRGETWKARNVEGNNLPADREVEVVGQEGLVLLVKPMEEEKNEKEVKE